MKSEKILVSVAIVLIVLALVGIGIVIAMNAGEDERIPDSETTAAEIQHEPEEYTYNSDGSIKSITYYDNNNYNGQVQYYTDDKGTKYSMTYNSKDEEIASTMTEINSLGAVTHYREREMGEITLDITYDYADDFETLTKQTAKTYNENGDEAAVKLYYAEDGATVIKKVEFLNGEEISEEIFDENHVFEEN